MLSADADYIDLLCPLVENVKELLGDVCCVPRHGNHGAKPYNMQKQLKFTNSAHTFFFLKNPSFFKKTSQVVVQ